MKSAKANVAKNEMETNRIRKMANGFGASKPTTTDDGGGGGTLKRDENLKLMYTKREGEQERVGARDEVERCKTIFLFGKNLNAIGPNNMKTN